MQLFKNTASQKVSLFAFDYTTGAPKTGDGANITPYVNLDWAGANALGDTSATEISSTNAPGWYLWDLTQGETNADQCAFTGKSSTGNVVIVGIVVTTRPAAFGLVAGATNGLFIAGTNAATAVTTSFTTTFTGNLTGSVASVTARVTANTDQLAGQTVTAAAGVTFPTSIASPTNITAGTITTATNLTNAPTAGDFTATMKTSAQTAAAAALTAYDPPTNAELEARTLPAADYFDPATDSVTVGTNGDKTGYRLSATGVDDIMDEVIEGTTTLRQSARLWNSAAGGKASGLETTNAKYRNLADDKDRIDATVDADGNRAAVTLDLT